MVSQTFPILRIAVLLTVLNSSANAGTSNSLLDISTDGKLLACSNRDSGTVTIVNLATHTKQFETSVGEKPEGVSFVGDSHQLAVAVYGDDVIRVVDADTGKVTATVTVFDEPYGLVSNRDGSRLFATLDYPGQVIEIDTATHNVVRSHDTGRFLRGLAIPEQEDRVYVTEFYTSNVKAIDVASGTIVDEWQGSSTDNLSRQLTLNPRRPKAYLPHLRSRVTANHGSGSIFPYVSIVDTVDGDGKRRTRIPIDTVFSTQITSNAWEIAVSPDGKHLYVVFAGTNDMFACNVIDDDYREISLQKRVTLGANPRAVRVSPDSQTVYAYNALDFTVFALDTTSLENKATITVTQNPLPEDILVGKKLFYTALQPMAGRRWISCSSCHPDGEPDGRTWHNPEGLRNTQSLAGMAATHPIHWSADRDEVQDFEHTIRGPLMQGKGLIRGKVQPSLGKPNAGLSTELDALAAYANSHKVARSPFAKTGLSEFAEAGKRIFFSEQTKCATCHAGPLFTDSQPAAADQIVRHDVGTGREDESETMGTKYDTPTLLGIYRTAPYLHDGTALTLMDVVTKNPGDAHGATSHLSDVARSALVDFLKSLPYE
jgi:DNA-binding beta-propeller fold protein YncE